MVIPASASIGHVFPRYEKFWSRHVWCRFALLMGRSLRTQIRTWRSWRRRIINVSCRCALRTTTWRMCATRSRPSVIFCFCSTGALAAKCIAGLHRFVGELMARRQCYGHQIEAERGPSGQPKTRRVIATSRSVFSRALSRRGKL